MKPRPGLKIKLLSELDQEMAILGIDPLARNWLRLVVTEVCDEDANMSETIATDDCTALGKIAYDNFTNLPGTIGEPASWEQTGQWPEERIPWISSAQAVARAVCPPDHHVVHDGDLRFLIALARSGKWTPEMVTRMERLMAMVGDKP